MRAPSSPSLARPASRRAGLRGAARGRMAAALVAACACGGSGPSSATSSGTCDVQPPCPLPIAVVLRVFPQGAPGPVPGATVTLRALSGTVVLGTFDCTPDSDASVCPISAEAGRYDLSVQAPGFVTADVRADVTPLSGGCCLAVNPVKLDVPLVPARP